MNNPYSSPEAGDSFNNDFDFETDLRIFSFSGRIGRARYLAYMLLLLLIFYGSMLVIGLIGGVIGSALGEAGLIVSGIVGLIGFAIMIFFLIFMFAIAVRRFNDIGWSGWLSILYLIPIINFFVFIILFVIPGSNVANQYGRRPPPNSAGAIVGAIIFPVILIAYFGVIFAIAIPAYHDYTERAKEAENRMLEERGINQDNNSEDYNDRSYSE